MAETELEKRYNQFLWLLYIDIAITAITALSSAWGIGVLNDIQAGRRSLSPALLSTINFWDYFGKLVLVTLVGVGIGLGRWLDACYTFSTSQLAASGFKHKTWTWAGWIIPIMNLFRPYQVINEIYKAGSREWATADEWRKTNSSGLLLTWWIFYAITHLIATILGRMMLTWSMKEDISVKQAIELTTASIFMCVFSVIVAILWLWVAKTITSRLLSRLGTATRGSNTRGAKDSTSATPYQSRNQYTGEKASDETYQRIAEELESGAIEKGLWTRLYAESDGDEGRTKAAYIRHRVAQQQEKQNQRVQASKTSSGLPVDPSSSSNGNNFLILFGIVIAIGVGAAIVIPKYQKELTENLGGTANAPELDWSKMPLIELDSLPCKKNTDCPATPPMMCDVATNKCFDVGTRPGKLDELQIDRPNHDLIAMNKADEQIQLCRTQVTPEKVNPDSTPNAWSKFLKDVDLCMDRAGYRFAKEKYMCKIATEGCYIAIFGRTR